MTNRKKIQSHHGYFHVPKIIVHHWEDHIFIKSCVLLAKTFLSKSLSPSLQEIAELFFERKLQQTRT